MLVMRMVFAILVVLALLVSMLRSDMDRLSTEKVSLAIKGRGLGSMMVVVIVFFAMGTLCQVTLGVEFPLAIVV